MLLTPLVVLATIAIIIASQSIITGAFKDSGRLTCVVNLHLDRW
jgi:K+ transporter